MEPDALVIWPCNNPSTAPQGKTTCGCCLCETDRLCTPTGNVSLPFYNQPTAEVQFHNMTDLFLPPLLSDPPRVIFQRSKKLLLEELKHQLMLPETWEVTCPGFTSNGMHGAHPGSAHSQRSSLRSAAAWHLADTCSLLLFARTKCRCPSLTGCFKTSAWQTQARASARDRHL